MQACKSTKSDAVECSSDSAVADGATHLAESTYSAVSCRLTCLQDFSSCLQRIKVSKQTTSRTSVSAVAHTAMTGRQSQWKRCQPVTQHGRSRLREILSQQSASRTTASCDEQQPAHGNPGATMHRTKHLTWGKILPFEVRSVHAFTESTAEDTASSTSA